VTMDEEDVRVEVFHIAGEMYGARVRCEFVFTNPGPARTLLMGFPTRLATEELDETSFDHPEVRDFTAFLDGEPLSVTPEEAATAPEGAPPLMVAEWATFEAAFGAGQTRRLVHSYEVTLPGDSTGESAAGYILRTGAMWAETIGRARVEFAMGPVRPWHLTSMSPGPFRFSGDNTWAWEERNIRPEQDLRITFRMRYFEDDPARIAPPGPWSAERRAQFDEVDLKAGDGAWLEARYLSVWEEYRYARVSDPYNVPEHLPVLLYYIASKFPPGSVPRALEPPEPPPEPGRPPGFPALSITPRGETGDWDVVCTVSDPDGDLWLVIVEVFSPGGERAVHFRRELRHEDPGPCEQIEIKAVAQLPREEMVFRATAGDAAGNVSISKPLTIQGETTDPGEPSTGPEPSAGRPGSGLPTGLLVGLLVAAAACVSAALIAVRRRRKQD